MSDALTTIENKIADLQKFCQDKMNFIRQIEDNIKQLNAEHANSHKQLSEVQGAVQGFAEAAKLIKAETPDSTATCDVHLVDAPVEAVAEPVVEAPVEVVAEPVAAE